MSVLSPECRVLRRLTASRSIASRPIVSRCVASRVCRGRLGFTLIELLIVIAILAVAAAVVTLSVPASDGRLVREEAARLGALFRIAQDEARVSGRALVWEA